MVRSSGGLKYKAKVVGWGANQGLVEGLVRLRDLSEVVGHV